jgi:hypothetical protein
MHDGKTGPFLACRGLGLALVPSGAKAHDAHRVMRRRQEKSNSCNWTAATDGHQGRPANVRSPGCTGRHIHVPIGNLRNAINIIFSLGRSYGAS